MPTVPGQQSCHTKHLLSDEKILSDEVHYTVKRLTTSSNETLPCSWPYTLMSTYPDTTDRTPCTQQTTTDIASDLTLFRTHYRLFTIQTNANRMK